MISGAVLRQWASLLLKLPFAKGSLGDKLQFVSDWRVLRKQASASATEMPFGRMKPIVNERSAPAGTASGHYFHQDLLVARRVFERAPRRHVDVGSRVDGLVAHIAAFREIDVFDVRAIEQRIPNVRFYQADLMQLDPALEGCCDSLSCLHALEHFGLGRYGDPVDFEGHLKGLENLARLLEPGGRLYLSVPVGSSRIEYNAHRVFALGDLLDMTRTHFELDRLAYVDDAGDLHLDPPIDETAVGTSFGLRYGCGIVELIKRSAAN